MLCQPKSPELPSAEATWLRARRAAGLPERAGLPLRSRWRNGSRFSAHEWARRHRRRPFAMPTGSSYVAQTDVYVHAEERVVTRNDGNLTRAHEAGEGIALCCIASQGHIVGGRTPQSLIKRYIFQLLVCAALGGGVYAAVRALLGSFSDCWCNENSDGIRIATYTFDKTTWDACQQGIPDGQIPTGDPLASVCPECTNPTSFCPCEYGQPAGTAEYVDPVLAYLVCWAVFGVWPTLFVLYKLLQ